MHVTLQVSPPPSQFQEFIEAAGGTFVPKMPTAMQQVCLLKIKHSLLRHEKGALL